MVRRAQGRVGDEILGEHARGGMDTRDLQNMFKRERREYPNKGLCEHCLARARRPRHGNVVPARRGNL